MFLPPSLPVSLNLFLHCLSLPLPSKSGFPTLLSLLLCILPGKAIHITYEPGWQALGADASFSSSSRQVTNLREWVGPTCLSRFQPFSSSFLLCSIFFFLSFCFPPFFFLHPVALKLLLVPGEQSPWHRGCAGIRTFPAAFTHVLCVAQLSFIFSFQKLLLGL